MALTPGGQAPWMVPGEHLLWVGHPDADDLSRRRWIAGRSLLVVAVLWVWSRLAVGPPVWFYAIGVVIIAMNLFATAVGPFLRRSRLRRTTYAVTDRRAAELRMPEGPPIDTSVATPLLTVRRADDGVHGSVDWGPSTQSVQSPPRPALYPGGLGWRRRQSFAVQLGLRDVDDGHLVFVNVADFAALLQAMTLACRAWGVDTPSGLSGERHPATLPWQQRPGPPPPTRL